MTCADCVDRACGTAVTFPPWSALVNTQTRRAAPMEAPPPLSPPRPHRRPRPCPRQTPPPHPPLGAKKPPRPGIFSPSGSSPDGPGSRKNSKHANLSRILHPRPRPRTPRPTPLLPLSSFLRILFLLSCVAAWNTGFYQNLWPHTHARFHAGENTAGGTVGGLIAGLRLLPSALWAALTQQATSLRLGQTGDLFTRTGTVSVSEVSEKSPQSLPAEKRIHIVGI